MRQSIAKLASYGIDPDAVLAEIDADIADHTRVFLNGLRRP
jgi:hypothetical protein